MKEIVMKNIMMRSIVSMLLVSGACLAGDFTVMRSLSPHQSKTSGLEIPVGKSTLNVTSETDGELISCRLSNESDETVNREKVSHCDFYFNMKSPLRVNLRVTNETSRPLDYRAVINEIK